MKWFSFTFRKISVNLPYYANPVPESARAHSETGAPIRMIPDSSFEKKFLHTYYITTLFPGDPNSAFTSKQGHAFTHSSGSISPFPLRSGLRSRCPHTRQPG